ncbi:MAG: SLC13 family permease [Prochlorotrichaceae cyanobacterium]|jgi:di/tricarboxylate transporter
MTHIFSPIVLTLGVILLSLVVFVGEWIPADVTALITATLLILLGLVTPEEGISGFGNSATITVMAMFILSAGISRTGAVLVARDALIRWGGRGVQRQILVMGAIVGPITAFINNTAVVAVFLPIIEEWCQKNRISPSRLLMPLSHVTVLGGMITVIGTSTNVLASGISKQLGYGEFSLFQFTQLGILTFIIGLIYLAFVGSRLLPDRKPIQQTIESNYDLSEYVSEVVVIPGSNLIGQTLQSSQIQRQFDFDVLELIRDETHFPQPVADKPLLAGDILLVRGNSTELLKIRSLNGLELLPDIQFGSEPILADLSKGEEGIGEVLVMSNSRLVGTTLKELRFRQRYNATVLAIRRGETLLRERLGQVRLKFGDLLLVQGPQQSLIGLQNSRELLLLQQRETENLRRDKAWISIAIILGVIIVSAFELIPIMVASLVGVILMILTGCLRSGEIYGAVRWDVIFLLAGLIPLGIAMDKSGATTWLASALVDLGGDLSGFWLLVFFYLITSILTELLSNNATVVLMIPIAVKVASTLSLNPLAFMYAVTFAASNSFMTPIGYQTNTMVYGPGGYRFLDFTRVGAPLNLILTIVTPFLITQIYGL